MRYLPSTQVSVQRRVELNQLGWQAFQTQPVWGIGWLNFIPWLSQQNIQILELWLQPAHHVFILLLAEVGLIGLGLVLILLFKSFKRTIKQQNWFLAAGLLVVVFTGSLDHYWLTLIQNRLLLVLLFALIWRNP
ncbi:hypothetical protein KKD62_03535 [Patescibacteria group bacterium]|nr:hypothetical protein [Patescibacteria group bacterium]